MKHHIKGEREYKFLNELEMRTTRCLGETPWEDGGGHADVSGERREVGPTFTKLGQIRPSDDLCGKGWACPVVFFLFSVLRVLSRNPLWMNEASRRQICWRVEGATRSMQQANLSRHLKERDIIPGIRCLHSCLKGWRRRNMGHPTKTQHWNQDAVGP